MSALFNDLCARLGVLQSMGRVGSALDNAVSESFNSVLKVEFVYRHSFATHAEARIRIATCIAGFYNTRRRHGAAGGLTPTEFEQIMKERRSINDHRMAQAADRTLHGSRNRQPGLIRSVRPRIRCNRVDGGRSRGARLSMRMLTSSVGLEGSGSRRA